MTCSFNVCPGGTSCEGCKHEGGRKMTTYSVAVRPTPEEVKSRHLYYDKAYYESRSLTYTCSSPEEAVKKYIENDKAANDVPSINVKKGQHRFLQPAEIPYVRAQVKP